MISTNDFKTGVTVEIDGDAWQVVEFQHVKPGKGAAFVRAKMRNLCTGAVVCLLYTSPSPRDRQKSRMPSSA